MEIRGTASGNMHARNTSETADTNLWCSNTEKSVQV